MVLVGYTPHLGLVGAFGGEWKYKSMITNFQTDRTNGPLAATDQKKTQLPICKKSGKFGATVNY